MSNDYVESEFVSKLHQEFILPGVSSRRKKEQNFGTSSQLNQKQPKEERESIVNEIRDNNTLRCREDRIPEVEEIGSKSSRLVKRRRDFISMRKSKSKTPVTRSVEEDSDLKVHVSHNDDLRVKRVNDSINGSNEQITFCIKGSDEKKKRVATRLKPRFVSRNPNSTSQRGLLIEDAYIVGLHSEDEDGVRNLGEVSISDSDNTVSRIGGQNKISSKLTSRSREFILARKVKSKTLLLREIKSKPRLLREENQTMPNEYDGEIDHPRSLKKYDEEEVISYIGDVEGDELAMQSSSYENIVTEAPAKSKKSTTVSVFSRGLSRRSLFRSSALSHRAKGKHKEIDHSSQPICIDNQLHSPVDKKFASRSCQSSSSDTQTSESDSCVRRRRRNHDFIPYSKGRHKEISEHINDRSPVPSFLSPQEEYEVMERLHGSLRNFFMTPINEHESTADEIGFDGRTCAETSSTADSEEYLETNYEVEEGTTTHCLPPPPSDSCETYHRGEALLSQYLS